MPCRFGVELVVLRPDGYIGWRGTDPDDPASWLRPLAPPLSGQPNGTASAGHVAPSAGSRVGSSR